MINYIRADLYRLNRRLPRLFWLFILLVSSMIFLVWKSQHDVWNSVNYTAAVASVIELVGILAGFFETNFAFSEDFKAKTMQMAIGSGISRRQVVMTKIAGLGTVMFLDLMVLYLCSLVFGLVTGIQILPEQIGEMSIVLLCTWMNVLFYASVISIVLFYFQSGGVWMMLYWIVMIDPVNVIIEQFSDNDIVAFLHLKSFTYTTILGKFQTQLVFGKFNFPSFLGIAIYFVLVWGITVFLFKKRELEF
ncbi:hypothetical protein [Brotaphodocola sp.]|uniref:hypothetical protein n=1 Tax=Brotaphodocola sp. TaxID=3073577 RepID=UPI003D7EB98D